jgi:hypothetical protein
VRYEKRTGKYLTAHSRSTKTDFSKSTFSKLQKTIQHTNYTYEVHRVLSKDLSILRSRMKPAILYSVDLEAKNVNFSRPNNFTVATMICDKTMYIVLVNQPIHKM